MLKPSDIGHISIHAPLTGSDLRRRTGMNTFVYFNPRSPHRERRSICSNRLTLVIFQSTLPSQGATNAFMMPTSFIAISIHAPLTGSDICKFCTTSAGTISIHAPLTGSDHSRSSPPLVRYNFNPRSPHRERRK